MPKIAAPPKQCPDRRVPDLIQELQAVVDRMQTASVGDAELDALLAQPLQRLRDVGGDNVAGAGAVEASGRWTSDISQALALLPPDYNFSLGRRDGVCWAWIQPNTRWEPAPYESRHDHPGGSGLAVAQTAALALASAATILRIRQLQGCGP